MNGSAEPPPRKRTHVPLRSFIIGLIVTAGLTSLFWFSLLLLTLTDTSDKDDQRVGFRVEMPEKVHEGEEFDMKIFVASSPRSQITIHSVDVEDTFSKGATILSIEPPPYSEFEQRFSRVFKVGKTLPAGTSFTWTFRLRAVQKGSFKGDVRIFNFNRSVGGHTVAIVVE